MAKKKPQTPEDIERLVQEGLEREKKDLLKDIAKGFVPQPTRSFEIGEEVKMGAHGYTEVIDKTDDGMLYLIHIKYKREANKDTYTREESHDKRMWRLWLEIEKKRDKSDWEKLPKFTQREEMRLQFFQSSLSSFHSYIYKFGVDMNPDYQRGLVWQLEDKQKLIDSIFKGVDIGKFVFIRRDYGSESHLYEILDGKQRLTAIMEFLEDRFKYNGFYYSELHPVDQSHIQGYSVSLAEVSNPTKEQIYRYFLRLNIGGKPMAQEQLDKVEKLLHDEIENKMNAK